LGSANVLALLIQEYKILQVNNMFNNFELTINMDLGNQFTCFASTNVQILTQAAT
jgi:hypothetical protein